LSSVVEIVEIFIDGVLSKKTGDDDMVTDLSPN
jgi:hypothetical protein